jgi:hypothetical protein
MRLFGISRAGLTTLTVMVATLWTCIALENAARRQGERDAREVAERQAQFRRTRPDSAPVAAPSSWRPSRATPS